MPGLPSLDLLSDAATEELAAYERRADALDSKAGVLLGFAGVVVAVSAANLDGWLAHASAIAAGVAALVAGFAFVPREFPTIALLPLRDKYLTSAGEFTQLRLLDTRIAMVSRVQATVRSKARSVTLASIALAIAVALGVLASIVDGGGEHRERDDHGTHTSGSS
jgi:drug/metabolite transporter (DMT)-like permease